MTVYELVNALEDLGYVDNLPVMVDAGVEWMTPAAVRLDEDRVLITLEAF